MIASFHAGFGHTIRIFERSFVCSNVIPVIGSKKSLGHYDQLNLGRSKRFLYSSSPCCQLRRFGPTKRICCVEGSTQYSVNLSSSTKDELHEFMAIFPDIVRDLTNNKRYHDLTDINKRLAEILEYTLLYGRRIRGLGVVSAFKILAPPDKLTQENVRLSHIMGWCTELLQAYIQILDDIIDGSVTRRGRLCLYKRPDIGMNAINDGLLIQKSVFQLLRIHFHDKPYYTKCMELFHDINFGTIIGQILDTIISDSFWKTKLEKYGMDVFKTTARYKTSYPMQQLPTLLAMHMVGIEDEGKHEQVKIIAEKIGLYQTIQDDYLDCFGALEETGKIGTDIQDGKCSWLIVMALKKVNNVQRKILEECYGSSDPEKINEVKKLYKQLGLPELFATYKSESYNSIHSYIKQMPAGLPKSIFFKILDRTYRVL